MRGGSDGVESLIHAEIFDEEFDDGAGVTLILPNERGAPGKVGVDERSIDEIRIQLRHESPERFRQ